MPLDHLGVRIVALIGVVVIWNAIVMWRHALEDDEAPPSAAAWIFFLTAMACVGTVTIAGVLYEPRFINAALVAVPAGALLAIAYSLVKSGPGRVLRTARDVPPVLYLAGMLFMGCFPVGGLAAAGVLRPEKPWLIVSLVMLGSGLAITNFALDTRKVREYLARSSWSTLTMDEVDPGYSYREADARNSVPPPYNPFAQPEPVIESEDEPPSLA